MARHAFIIGGTGQIGIAIARDLLARGWQVTLAHRGHRPPPSEPKELGAVEIIVDRRQAGALTAAFKGADAIIDTVAFTPAEGDQLLAVEGDAGALVIVSSASVYADEEGRSLDEAGSTGFPELPNPIVETQVTVQPGPATYSTNKVAVERRLLDGAQGPVTILRPCAIHGTQSVHPREWWFVKRMLDGRKTIPLAFGGTSLFHTTAVANIAAVVRATLDAPGTRILNVGDPSPPSVGEIGETIAAVMNWQGAFVPVAEGEAPGVGDTPWSTPRSFLISMRAAEAIGYVPAITYAKAMPAVCAWLSEVGPKGDWKKTFPVLAGYPADLFDYTAEDAYLAVR